MFLKDLAAKDALLLYLTARAAYHIAGGEVTSSFPRARVNPLFEKILYLSTTWPNGMIICHFCFLLHELLFEAISIAYVVAFGF